jgi:hypothetical protein
LKPESRIHPVIEETTNIEEDEEDGYKSIFRPGSFIK